MLMEQLTLGDIDSQFVKEKAKKISETIKSPLIIEEDNIEKILKSKKVPIKDKLGIVEKRVHQVLGKYKDNTLVIRDKEEFHQYISDAINNNFISIDTETNNSLDPLTCKLMGLCIHTYNHKQAYIPVNHVNLDTGEKLINQLTEQDIKEELSRLGDTKVIMHNGKFDYQVIKCTCDIALNVYWDTMLGARLEDENAKAGLKQQYVEKIDPEDEKYNIKEFFAGLEYAVVPPELFALYAATDAYKTTRLYDYQLEWFNKPENNKLLKVLREIEMPILTVSAEMELRGICLDFEYGKRLSEKYHKLLDDVDKEIDKVLIELKTTIDAWKESAEGQVMVKKKTKAQQLSDPISLTSPTQLAILFYDILKVGVIDKENPRGTGAEIIDKIYEKTKNPLCKLIIDKRGLVKLLNTYIDKLPESVNPSDHRLHGEFNQMGTDTGRFSSYNPNLQNIPAHAKDIRPLFIASPGYKLVGADFSQAEPRLLAWSSQDETMITAYKDKRDLYATVASTVFNNKYEDNLEFYPDGSMNYEGKERRSFCKSVILGIMYGRGAPSIAEQIGKTTEEAQVIIDSFYHGFPKVKIWMNKILEEGKRSGYVETLWGRRRRLPDIKLSQYTVTSSINNFIFNPFIDCEDKEDAVIFNKIKLYQEKLQTIKTVNDYLKLKNQANKDNILITNNIGKIKQAERQCINSVIQGGSADITKRAMISIDKDEELRELRFRILLCIHDEIVGECPEENAEKVAKRLSYLMMEAPKPDCMIPFKCDSSITNCWYEEEYATWIKEDFEKLNHDFNKLCEIHPERTLLELHKIIK